MGGNRWIVVVGGMYGMFIAGICYTFPNFASDLQEKLNLNQENTNLVGTLMNVGTWLGVAGGIIYDRYGPHVLGIIAICLCFTGYFLMYLATKGDIPHSAVAVGLYGLIGAQGGSCVYTVALNTSVKNFSAADRGKIVGALVCCFGLSAAIFSTFHKAFFNAKVADFILLLCLAATSGALIATVTAKVHKKANLIPLQKKRIIAAYALIVTLALYIASGSLASNFANNVNTEAIGIALGVLLLSLWLLAIGAPRSPPGDSRDANGEPNDKAVLLNDDTGSLVKPAHKGMTLGQSVCSVDYWLIFAIFGCVIGSGITIVDNIPGLVISRLSGPVNNVVPIEKDDLSHHKDISTFVVLFSVCNTFGRLAAGSLSDIFLYKVSRPAWLVAAAISMGLVQVIFIFASTSMMYPGVIMLGFTYGTTFCVIPTYVSEKFGLDYFGSNFGLQGLAPAIGSELLATLLAGKLSDHYKKDKYILVHDGNNEIKHCLGSVCYHTSLAVNAGLCALAAILALILTVRGRRSGGLEVKNS